MRLRAEGLVEDAKALKNSKLVLMASERTRKRKDKDKDARDGKVVSKGNELLDKPETRTKGGSRERYDELFGQNVLLSFCEISREMLTKAYTYRQEKAG